MVGMLGEREPGRTLRPDRRRRGRGRSRRARGGAGSSRSGSSRPWWPPILPVGRRRSWSGMALAMAPRRPRRDQPAGGACRMIGAALAAAVLAVAAAPARGASTSSCPGTTLSSFTGVPGPDQPSDLAALLRFEVGPLGERARSAGASWWPRPCRCSSPAPSATRGRCGGGRSPWSSFARRLGGAAGHLPVALAGGRRAPRAGRGGPGPRHRHGRRAPSRSTCPGTASAGGRSPPALPRRRSWSGIVPVLGASFDGRWSMPAGDHARSLSFIDVENDETPFRVLWLGDPAAAPARRVGARGRPRLRHDRRRLAHAGEPVGGIRRRRHRAARRRPRPGPHGPDRPPRPPPRPDGRALRRRARAVWPPTPSPPTSSRCRRRSAPPSRRSSTSSRSTCPPG